MDNLLDASVSLEDFTSQIDSHIQQLPLQLQKPLKKRTEHVAQALYQKPVETVQTYSFQAKTRVSRPINPSVVLQDSTFRIPRNMTEAYSSPQREHWIIAKDKECNSFKERRTYITPSIPIS